MAGMQVSFSLLHPLFKILHPHRIASALVLVYAVFVVVCSANNFFSPPQRSHINFDDNESDGGVLVPHSPRLHLQRANESRLPCLYHEPTATSQNRIGQASASDVSVELTAVASQTAAKRTAGRSTERSKPDLSVTVPTLRNNGSVMDPHFVGSSPSGPCIHSGGRQHDTSSNGPSTGSSFGAVGDHLSNTKEPLRDASSKTPSSNPMRAKQQQLYELVQMSTPDHEHDNAVVEQASNFERVSDSCQTRLSPSKSHTVQTSSPELSVQPAANRASTHIHTDASEFLDSLSGEWLSSLPRHAHPTGAGLPDPFSQPELWRRQGHSYYAKIELATGHDLEKIVPSRGYDPDTFTLPYGSVVYIMKAANITNLRTAVKEGIWSNKEGANKVLQTAWQKRDNDEKIVLLFSVNHSHKHNGKYCGMAEMIGPYDPTAEGPSWAKGSRDIKGGIPIRWLVTKDVPFSAFDDIKYRGQPVTQLRHANTIPDETGRVTIRRYFEAPHSMTAVLHPAERGFESTHPTWTWPNRSWQPLARPTYGTYAPNPAFNRLVKAQTQVNYREPVQPAWPVPPRHHSARRPMQNYTNVGFSAPIALGQNMSTPRH